MTNDTETAPSADAQAWGETLAELTTAAPEGGAIDPAPPRPRASIRRDEEHGTVTIEAGTAMHGPYSFDALPPAVQRHLGLTALGVYLNGKGDPDAAYAALAKGELPGRREAVKKVVVDLKRRAVAYALADERLDVWKGEQKDAGTRVMPQDAAKKLAELRDEAERDVSGWDAAQVKAHAKRWQVVRHFEQLTAAQ